MNGTSTAETRTASSYSHVLHAQPTRSSSAPWHVLGMMDLGGRLTSILDEATALKEAARVGPLPPLLAGRAVAMIFEKNSTRTRVSFEVGIQKLGGIVTILDAQSSQLGRGESLEDTALVLSRYVDAIVYRAKDHVACSALAEHARVPVINALTDVEHPCQALADLMALREHLEATTDPGLAGKTFAYVGDGNNVCHSYMLAAPMVGMDIAVATPPGYGPSAEVVQQAQGLAAAAGTTVTVCHEPMQAVTGAIAVATDTWVSMGSEADEAERLESFAGYTVDDALLDQAHPDAAFLHCLPGHWGFEATHEVAHGPRSLILDEAENRMWVQMALLVHLLRVGSR